MEIQSTSNGQQVRFSVPCACSRVFFHIDYDGRYIEYNGDPGKWIDTYDAPVVTEIGATMIHVPHL